MERVQVDTPAFIEAGPQPQGAIDYLGIVERAYDLTSAPDEWLNGLLMALRPALDRGAGIFGWFLHEAGVRHVSSPTFLGTPSGMFEANRRHSEFLDPEHGLLLATAAPCASFQERLGKEPIYAAAFEETFGPLGFADVRYLRALDCDLRGPVFAAPQPMAGRLHPRRRVALERVGAHIAAGYRLRARMAVGPVFPEAVLDPKSGEVLHAEGVAKPRESRRLLSAAGLRLNTARTSVRRDTFEQALALWRALVAGRWTLVDRIDRDGRRFLVALRNSPQPRHPRAVSPEERPILALHAIGHPSKVVAYELGQSVAGVSSLLRSGLTKLGLRSRAELLRLITGRASGEGPQSAMGSLGASS
jgi:DNA-binding CsgD family transcriptional regulator